MTYFSSKTFDFLTALAANNSRDWFHDHKADYEANLRQPFLRLIADLQPDMAAVSGHFRSDPKPVGGSLFRIHRDTRFSGNKTPYKTWAGARLFHERARQVPAPSFYLHIQPGNCFVGAGLWHPETATLRRVRDFIVENPSAWQKAAHDPIFRRRYRLDDSEMLVRPPRGYPADHPLIDDLRHKNFVALRSIDDAIVTGPRLRPTLAKDLAGLAPLVDYLCAALELDF
jgi:uncharacterized protein (TIGR02453 family)